MKQGISVLLICVLLAGILVGCCAKEAEVIEGGSQAFQTNVYFDSGGDKLVVASGGEVEIQSGGTFDPQDDFVLSGTTPKLTIGDAGAEDTQITFDGNAQDFYVCLDDSADDILVGLGGTCGTTPGLGIDENLAVAMYGDVTMGGTTPVLTVGDAGAEDTAIVFDGNADDFYIALDDSADDLLIGYGSTVGTDARISIQDHLTTTTVVIGDAQEADMQILFDGNAQDYHIGLDDTADALVVGKGSALGTTTAFSIDSNQVTTWSGGQLQLTEAASAADTITAAECGKTFFLSGNDYTLTLPAVSGVSGGCEFRFIVATAPTTSTVILTGNTDEDVLIGGINELEVDTSDDGPYDASADTITFVGGTAALGDFVYMISDGSFFYVSGQANADGGVTITDSD